MSTLVSPDVEADLLVRLQPKQSELWRLWDESSNTRLGFGGARGGTKSAGGRRCMLLRRLKYPMTTGLILRRTYPQLYKSHLVKLWEEFPKTRRWYNQQNKEMVFPNGSRLFFGSAEHAGDLDSFYSAEFADVMIDEAQSFSQNEIERLSGSVRCTSNPDIVPKMLMTFMPGVEEDGTPPKGLPYLKRVFIEKDIRGTEKEQQWAFLQAFGWDNIEWGRKQLGWFKDERGQWQMGPNAVSEEEFYSWPEKQRRAWFLTTDFGKQIAAVTDKGLLAAWLDGKWDTFEGQYFAHWNYETHTIPAQQFQMKKFYRRWISCDWGDDHPCVVHWHAQDEKGKVFTYREIWGRGIGETKLGEMIGDIEKQYVDQGYQKLCAFWMSWDAFGKLNKQTRKSITVMIGEALPNFVPKPNSAGNDPGSRISGWRLMSELLKYRRWEIVRPDHEQIGCPHLIECVPTLVRDMARNTEDVLKIDYSENYIGDDPADCARYGLQNMVRPSVKPLAVKLEEQLLESRQRFANISPAMAAAAARPGVDWFSKFGGKAAKKH